MKKYLKWIICILSLLIFIILSILVLNKKDIYLDSIVYKSISKYISNDLTSVIKYLTYFGSALVVISITLFTLIFVKNKKYSFYMALNLIIITILQLILKNIFTRSRPLDINLITETGYSFPSGHSLTAFVFYGFIIYLIYVSKIKNKKIYITLFSLLIIVTGLSRIYLGVHFFTDVIGGFSFALSYLIIYISLVKRRINGV